jgi:hypothetical protein
VKAAARALADNLSWNRQSKEFLKVALWAFRYIEDTPSCADVARALISAQHGRPKESA